MQIIDIFINLNNRKYLQITLRIVTPFIFLAPQK